MNRVFVLVGLIVTGLMPILFVSGASAALIDIVVVGTWQTTNNPVVNPFLLNSGDKFVVKSTYDDATFFNGDEGVTADVDPGINPGTSLEFIIPHPGPAPNPVTFDHSDHINIGFAPNAQIEFDGPNAGNPGNFRNFEFHFENNFAGDAMEYDQFHNLIQEETSITNASQGFNKAATATGAHLEVVINDITADAGGPYVFDSSNLSLNTNGSSGGGSGFSRTFDWTGPGGALANSPGANIAFGLAESGLLNTTDTSSISLVATEDFTDFNSAAANASVSYTNTAPVVSVASGVTRPDLSVSFVADFDDDDLAVNALVVGFETLIIEFLFDGNVFLAGEGNVDLTTLLGIFGSPGTYEVIARATDSAGTTNTLAFNIDVFGPPVVPSLSPLGIALLSSLLGLAAWRKLRR